MQLHVREKESTEKGRGKEERQEREDLGARGRKSCLKKDEPKN